MRVIVLAAGLAAFAASVAAENVVATNPSGVLAWFQAEGIPAKLEEDSVGDPLVTVRYFDSDFDVYFYGCQQHAACTSLQFFSGYRVDGAVTLETANEWNSGRLFSRAYITEEGSARLEYDVFTGVDGVSAEDFDDIVSLWTSAQSDFEDLIDW
ncbi:MAG: YbjN domain-containing protein [Pseudomonadota bacterium]